MEKDFFSLAHLGARYCTYNCNCERRGTETPRSPDSKQEGLPALGSDSGPKQIGPISCESIYEKNLNTLEINSNNLCIPTRRFFHAEWKRVLCLWHGGWRRAGSIKCRCPHFTNNLRVPQQFPKRLRKLMSTKPALPPELGHWSLDKPASFLPTSRLASVLS